MSDSTPLECVLGLIRAVESGGGSESVRPYLADDFKLTEWPHVLSPTGAIRDFRETLSGAEQSRTVVRDQHFDIVRSTSEGGRVVLEMNWSATLLLDLPHWNAGETIRARSTAVFEVVDGKIRSQDSYDCYFTEPGQEAVPAGGSVQDGA
ncbi:nuclear transport factor 2 family protein [Arthrobacter sp. AZCC_0090]|uniref:nuclear transport factor 2 family protein n=1 Tax=Arthrobacter sp. AZCC_0090 TaxID=2735881 RepID=UPI001622F4ED|nr:nuclear transport factor 2 family protein [Arthrobacter sp. AZCC_0090]MBB6403040.1 limonene-1,2-epoxide hydrolase [Arthrobacter sp. AZCC_0090]